MSYWFIKIIGYCYQRLAVYGLWTIGDA